MDGYCLLSSSMMSYMAFAQGGRGTTNLKDKLLQQLIAINEMILH